MLKDLCVLIYIFWADNLIINNSTADCPPTITP